MKIRHLQPEDYDSIIINLNEWWGGRQISHALPRLFFDHFHKTSFIMEQDNKIIGFLVGFLSPSQPDEAYIHFIGVHPDYRKQGIANTLYNRFFDLMRENHRSIVHCVTAPINKVSIAYHTRMGFQILPQTNEMDGTSYCVDYDGPGEDRVLFEKYI
jgi:ribosomal protein S18 acetylase RimI-like enzyme